MASWLRNSLIVLVFAGGIAAAAIAQDSPPADLPRLDLSAAQKQTIYQSVINQKDSKKGTAPDSFRATPGAHVPDSVTLEPMPKTVVQLIPQTQDFQVGLVSNQVLIVEPKGRRVVDVLTQSGG
jgi:Protein of unknown function (DUF1236)